MFWAAAVRVKLIAITKAQATSRFCRYTSRNVNVADTTYDGNCLTFDMRLLLTVVLKQIPQTKKGTCRFYGPINYSFKTSNCNDNFRRDANSEREVEVWEKIAHHYQEATASRPDLSPDAKRELFSLLLK